MSHARAAASSWQGTRMTGAGRPHRRHPAVRSIYGQDACPCEQNVEALWRKKLSGQMFAERHTSCVSR